MCIRDRTESQIIASVGTFGALLVLFLMSNISSLLPSASAGTFLAVSYTHLRAENEKSTVRRSGHR